jgi:prevent-host-death family protein
MTKSYSIADAKNLLGRVVHEAEEGSPVELTRRGRPVAMVISVPDFERLSLPRRGFTAIYEDLRRRFDLAELDIDPDEVFAAGPDASAGKDFSW